MAPQCGRFEGQVVIITAATAGIGLGIAHRLGQEGARLVICSRRQVLLTIAGDLDQINASLNHFGAKEKLIADWRKLQYQRRNAEWITIVSKRPDGKHVSRTMWTLH